MTVLVAHPAEMAALAIDDLKPVFLFPVAFGRDPNVDLPIALVMAQNIDHGGLNVFPNIGGGGNLNVHIAFVYGFDKLGLTSPRAKAPGVLGSQTATSVAVSPKAVSPLLLVLLLRMFNAALWSR